jgi:asparagine synthase (glutamine-hydrolysing)
VCGIFGVFETGDREVDLAGAERALETLAHRGPDDAGLHHEGPIVLGHRRLTIMDLSAAGRQPMTNEDRSVWITFNGELYGFRRLRDELTHLGHRFASTADTEVLVHGYEEWGLGVLDRIDGMFAFGLWDVPRQRLLLARDRLGKKPLFLARDASRTGFASQLRPLIAADIAKPVVRPDALREYLYLNYVIGPKTIFDGVELVPPATWVTIDRTGMHSGRYWDLAAAAPPVTDDLQATFESLLLDACRDRLVSDAPLGIFLSGGIDSAVIAALAQRESSSRRQTFSVGFEDPSYDERPKARAVAGRIDTDHHEIVCAPGDVPVVLPYVTACADHLLADQSMIPLAKLARETKRHVKVVLTGDGGDELLAGYSTYVALRIARVYLHLVPAAVRRWLAEHAGRLPTGARKMSWPMLLGRFLGATSADLATAHASWRCIWTHREIDALLDGRWGGEHESTLYAARMTGSPDWNMLQRAVSADMRTWLVDSILAKVDRTTMAAGLEARSPLLDSRLVAFCFTTILTKGPPSPSKAPLRRLATKLLGEHLARTKKEGFQTPFASWFAGPLRPYVRERLEHLQHQLPGLFDAHAIRRVENEHARASRNHDLKIWSLLTLSAWAELFDGLTVSDAPPRPLGLANPGTAALC